MRARCSHVSYKGETLLEERERRRYALLCAHRTALPALPRGPQELSDSHSLVNTVEWSGRLPWMMPHKMRLVHIPHHAPPNSTISTVEFNIIQWRHGVWQDDITFHHKFTCKGLPRELQWHRGRARRAAIRAQSTAPWRLPLPLLCLNLL